MANYTDRNGNPITELEFLNMNSMYEAPTIGLDSASVVNGDNNPWTWDTSSFNPSNDGFSNTMSGMNDMVGAASGLYGMYQGNQMLGMYRDQVDDAKTNSARMRADMDRRDATRKEWGSAFQQA